MDFIVNLCVYTHIYIYIKKFIDIFDQKSFDGVKVVIFNGVLTLNDCLN